MIGWFEVAIPVGENPAAMVESAGLALFALHWTGPGVVSGLAASAAKALTGPPEPSFRAMSQLHQSAVQGTPFLEQEADGLSLELLQFG